jgi:hypothetical protein
MLLSPGGKSPGDFLFLGISPIGTKIRRIKRFKDCFWPPCKVAVVTYNLFTTKMLAAEIDYQLVTKRFL